MALSPVDKPAKPAWKAALWPGLLLASLVAVYLPALRGSLLWDDDAHVTRPALQSVHGLWRVWFDVGATQQYYPLLHSAFWLEHRLWGDSAFGYHLLTLGFHWVAACLLASVLRRLGFAAPWLAAFVFALHPVCVESVAWISEQKNTLSAVLYLLAALSYLSFDRSRKPAAYAGATLLFVLALLTKTVTATLPAALLVVFWWRSGSLSLKRDVGPLAPWFVLGIGAGLFTAWAERTYIGATGSGFALSFVERLVLCGRVLCFYAKTLLWPSQVMFIYSRWSPSDHLALQALALLGVLIVAAALIILARRSRGPLAGLLFFAGTLFPALGFFNVYPFLFSFVADHFQYLASLGILVPVAWVIDWLAEDVTSKAGRLALVAVIPVVLGVLSNTAARDYRDADTLNRATIGKNPGAWLAHYNLAVSLNQQPGGLEAAISEYRETLRLNPSHWSAESNLATALSRKPGWTAEAIQHYTNALALNPNFAEAHNDLGVLLSRSPASREEALEHLQRAIALKPDYDAAYNNLGDLLLSPPASLADAVAAYEKAIALKPDDPLYHYNLANALGRNSVSEGKAIAEYREAIRLKPDYVEAHANLGNVLSHSSHSILEGIGELSTAVRLAPTVAITHAGLANALARLPSRRPQAAAEYETAVKLDPADVQTRLAYAILLSGLPDQLPQARVQAAEAVRLLPNLPEAHFALGVIELRLHEPKAEAIAEFRRTLQLRPDFAPAQRLLRQVQASAP